MTHTYSQMLSARDTPETYRRTRKIWIKRQKKGLRENTSREKDGSYIDIRENGLEGTILLGAESLPASRCDPLSFPRTVPLFGLSFPRGTRLAGWHRIISATQSTRRPPREKMSSDIFQYFLLLYLARSFSKMLSGCFFLWYFWFESLCCICHREVSPPQIVWNVKPGGKCTYYH